MYHQLWRYKIRKSDIQIRSLTSLLPVLNSRRLLTWYPCCKRPKRTHIGNVPCTNLQKATLYNLQNCPNSICLPTTVRMLLSFVKKIKCLLLYLKLDCPRYSNQTFVSLAGNTSSRVRRISRSMSFRNFHSM